MNKKLGFTALEILILVAVVALIAAIAIPSYVKRRDLSQQNACIGNLLCIDMGKRQYAEANRLSNGCPVLAVSVNEYVHGGTTPTCPAGGTYTYGNIGSSPRCSITTPRLHIYNGSGN
jgi:competence protein ComGC